LRKKGRRKPEAAAAVGVAAGTEEGVLGSEGVLSNMNKMHVSTLVLGTSFDFNVLEPVQPWNNNPPQEIATII
jgi:hypothetical protein